MPNSECLFWQVILNDCHERKYYKIVLTENLEVLYWKKNLKLSHSRSSGIVRFDFIPDNQHLTIRVSVKKVNLRCVESYLPYSISPLFYECSSNYFISKIAHRHSCTGTVSAASLYQRNWLMRNKIIVNIQILKTTFFYPVEKPKPKINQFLYLKASNNSIYDPTENRLKSNIRTENPLNPISEKKDQRKSDPAPAALTAKGENQIQILRKNQKTNYLK